MGERVAELVLAELGEAETARHRVEALRRLAVQLRDAHLDPIDPFLEPLVSDAPSGHLEHLGIHVDRLHEGAPASGA